MTDISELLAKTSKLIESAPSVGTKSKRGVVKQRRVSSQPLPSWKYSNYFRQVQNTADGVVKYLKGLRHYMTYYDHYGQLDDKLDLPGLQILHVYQPEGRVSDLAIAPQAVVCHAHPAGSYQCATGCHVALLQGTGSDLDKFTKYQFPNLYSYEENGSRTTVIQEYEQPTEEQPPGKYWV
jgi:hypothetical protein